MRATAPTLFDDESVPTAGIRVADTVVAPVSQNAVREFCAAYHYTHTGESAIRRWGLWHGMTLLGVVSYNPAPYGLPQAAFGDDCPTAGMWNMHRLALSDDAPHNSESRLIAGSLRALHLGDPTIWSVVTYAASDVGHIGYVYQATNALYTGTGGFAHYYITADGERRGAYATGQQITPADATARGWTVHKDAPKHRYVYILGNRTERRHRRAALRWAVLPYPKANR